MSGGAGVTFGMRLHALSSGVVVTQIPCSCHVFCGPDEL